jgi:hypothetical protein
VNWRKLRAWIPAFAILEIGAAIMSLAYMGKRSANTTGEGNKIARLVLDHPTDLESFLFYFILAHALIGIFLFIGWVAAKRKNIT